jgi:hypothetical protein
MEYCIKGTYFFVLHKKFPVTAIVELLDCMKHNTNSMAKKTTEIYLILSRIKVSKTIIKHFEAQDLTQYG